MGKSVVPKLMSFPITHKKNFSYRVPEIYYGPRHMLKANKYLYELKLTVNNFIED